MIVGHLLLFLVCYLSTTLSIDVHIDIFDGIEHKIDIEKM